MKNRSETNIVIACILPPICKIVCDWARGNQDPLYFLSRLGNHMVPCVVLCLTTIIYKLDIS